MEKQKEYWLGLFKDDDIPALSMPLDYPRPTRRNISEGDHICFTIEKKLTGKLYNVVKETGATLFMVLFAAYNVLLSIYTRQEKIVVGTLLPGRSHADLQNVIGMFINTLPIKSYPKRDKSYKEFLKEIKESVLGVFENQDYPFDELVINLGLQGDPGRNPLFDTLFTLNPFISELEIKIKNSPLTFEPYEKELEFAKFDLHLIAMEMEETIDIQLRYSTQLYKPSTIRKIAKYYIEILEQTAGKITVNLGDIIFSHNLLTPELPDQLEEEGDFAL
jgi:non-ribosomal peptide synthetase component F